MKVIDKIKRSTKSKLIIILIIVLIIITSIGIAYAKYVTTLHGRTEAKIAQWSFKVNGQSNENFTINLADTRIENQQQANVEDGFVGPGTSGVFKIVIDGTGSEVSLGYDINMDIDVQNNEKFPKNLIFYSDAEMKNAIYHGDNSINLNGYILQSDTNKVNEKIIYWKWDYETGQTEDEKNANDISDSEWMGKNVSLNINVAGRQVEETFNNNQCKVVFDANGGVLQGYGNASLTSKVVEFADEYGDLPVPIREGYRFVGWNGKNLAGDIKRDRFSNSNVVKFLNNKIIIDLRESDNTKDQSIKFQIWNSQGKHVKNEEKLSYQKGYIKYKFLMKPEYSTVRIAMNGDKKDGGFAIKIQDLKINTTYTISYNIDVYKEWYSEISNIQIEEGTEATTYEPYIITASTQVVQKNNHVLKAIWEKL